MVNYKQTFLFRIREDSLKRILYNTSKWHTFPYKPITRGKKETCRWEITSLQLWLLSNSSFLIPGSAKELSGRRYILAWNNASSYPPAAVSILTAMRLTSQFHLVLLPPLPFCAKAKSLNFHMRPCAVCLFISLNLSWFWRDCTWKRLVYCIQGRICTAHLNSQYTTLTIQAT